MSSVRSGNDSGAFIRDQSAVSLDFLVLSTQRGDKNLVVGGIPLPKSSNLTLTFQLYIVNGVIVIKCSKCSLVLHCVTVDDLGRNGPRHYHRANWHGAI